MHLAADSWRFQEPVRVSALKNVLGPRSAMFRVNGRLLGELSSYLSRCFRLSVSRCPLEFSSQFLSEPSPPPFPWPLCRHLIIYIKLTFAEFTQGSVIVFFPWFCITNHENGILSSLTNF